VTLWMSSTSSDMVYWVKGGIAVWITPLEAKSPSRVRREEGGVHGSVPRSR